MSTKDKYRAAARIGYDTDYIGFGEDEDTHFTMALMMWLRSKGYVSSLNNLVFLPTHEWMCAAVAFVLEMAYNRKDD